MADEYKREEEYLKDLMGTCKIAVFGDYDCDGVLASHLLHSGLQRFGAKVSCGTTCAGSYRLPGEISAG
jgi:single-stranded DNA-specific DHH superfamily exonuclease